MEGNSDPSAPYAVNVNQDPGVAALENYTNFDMDMPSAPMLPAQIPPQIPPHNPYQADALRQEETPPVKRRSSRHMLYAVEILVFSLVGWGWLAVREYLGSTPVLDVSVLLSLLISSLINFALSMVYHTTDQFKPAAQAFLAHALSLWALYLYGLSESTTARPGPLCCKGVSTYSVPQTYAAAYFGNLPFHQAAGMVTVAFLSVHVVVSAAQVRACLNDPREWLTRDVLIAVVCLFSLHLGLFTRAAGVCGDEGLGLGVVVFSGLMLAVMLRVPEEGVEVYEVLSAWLQKRKKNEGNAKTNQAERKRKEPSPILVLVQQLVELLTTIMLAAMAAVLSSKLGGAPSALLVIVFVGVMLWLAVTVAFGVVEVLGTSKSKSPRQLPEDPYAPSAPPKQQLVSRYSSGRPVMVLPSVREMRLHGTRRREKKAW